MMNNQADKRTGRLTVFKDPYSPDRWRYEIEASDGQRYRPSRTHTFPSRESAEWFAKENARWEGIELMAETKAGKR